MGRLLGLDFGDRHVGVAISDPERRVATPRDTITYGAKVQLVEALEQLVFDEEIDELVIGLPLSLSGGDSEQTKRVRAFAQEIGPYLDLPVQLEDERYTTRQAERGFTKQDDKSLPSGDARAAQLILQSYLDRLSV